MNRNNISVPEMELSEIYRWVDYFRQHFDNAEDAAAELLDGIIQAYQEEQQRLYHRTVDRESARVYLETRHNTRGAGRHAKLKSRILELLRDGSTPEEIALAVGCSVSYVRKIRAGLIN